MWEVVESCNNLSPGDRIICGNGSAVYKVCKTSRFTGYVIGTTLFAVEKEGCGTICLFDKKHDGSKEYKVWVEDVLIDDIPVGVAFSPKNYAEESWVKLTKSAVNDRFYCYHVGCGRSRWFSPKTKCQVK